MNINVGRIEISVTANGTPKALVYPEGSDFSNVAEGIELLGENDVLYLATRKVGETIEVVEKGRWRNVVIPQEYLNLLNSPNYDRIKLLFKRSLSGINKAMNGTRTPLEINTAELLVSNNVDVFAKVEKCIEKSLKNTDTDFAKTICEDLKSKDPATKYGSLDMLFKLTNLNIQEICKEYSIQNDGLEPKKK